MFIQETSTVDIVIHYKKKGMHYLAYSEADFEDLDLEDEEKSEYKKITVKMKQLTWGLYNDLQEGSVDTDMSGNRRFNYKRYKESRLIKLIVGWDATAKDARGEDVAVKVTEKSIKSLAPEIAECILNSYDQKVYFTEEDEKK